MTETALQKINEIERAIIKVQTIEEGMDCYARIGAVREYGRKRNMGKPFQNSLVICELRAERKNGDFLRKMAERGERETRGGDRKSNRRCEGLIPLLDDLGINESQSIRWQLLTWIYDKKFEQEIVRQQSRESSIAKNNFYSLGRKYKRESEKAERPRPIEPIVYHMDYSDFLARFEVKSVNLLLTDPPYMTEFKDENEFKKFVQSWVPLAISKIKGTGRIYIFTGNYPKELHIYLTILLEQDDFILSNILVWGYFNTIGPSPKMEYKQSWNAVFYLHGKEADKLNCPKLKEQFDVQIISAPDGRHEIRYSPFQKPDEIAKRFISHSTKEADLMVDPFAGTGTFLLVAGELGRKALGAENDKKMIEICKKRGLVTHEV